MVWMTVLSILSGIASLLMSNPGENDVNAVIDQCLRESKEFAENEYQYARNDSDSSSPIPTDLFGRRYPEILLTIYDKELWQRIFECIADKLNVYSNSELEGNEKYENLVEQCRQEQEEPRCDPSYRYRTMDGTCNNLKHPKWGSSLSCSRREMPANYEGAAGFRKSVCGKPLPDTRNLTLVVHYSKNRPEKQVTQVFVFWGQFVAHEISDIPTSLIFNQTIECCKRKEDLHPQCAPIYISRKDPFYWKYNVTCFNFVRASPCDSCSVGKRNQLNEATAYIDGSVVYGSYNFTAQQLRRNDGTGKLVIQNRRAGKLLPPDPIIPVSVCGREEKRQYCFQSGDRRVIQTTLMMTMHTIFHREHNRIAEELKRLNPEWDEEKLYQEARKINIAQLQVIIYKEYLPLLLGSDIMKHYDLEIRKEGRTSYDPEVDATMESVFNSAGYRLHSIVNGETTAFPVDRGRQLLRDMFNRASPIYNGDLEWVVRGLSLQPAQKFDRHFTFEVINYLYREPGKPGLDLVAINIQRGRDNGMPPYTDVVHHFWNGSINIQSFDDLKQLMDEKNIEILKSVYCDVRDIDIYVGLNNERTPNKDGQGIVGPTTARIIAKQLWHSKYGDRFYFEHSGIFTDDQLQTIRQASLSKIICDNTNITILQENAMSFPDEISNRNVSCSEIPGVDLSFWKE